MPQDKIDLSDFDELFYDGLEVIKTESGLPTKGVKRRIKENISLEDIKQYIQTKLSTEIKKAKRNNWNKIRETIINEYEKWQDCPDMTVLEVRDKIFSKIQEEINKLK